MLLAGKRPVALMDWTRVWTTKWRWPVFRSAAPRTEIRLAAGRQAGRQKLRQVEVEVKTSTLDGVVALVTR